MIAAVLFEVTMGAAPEAAPPRKPVSAEPVTLSAVASRIQINRKALDGWVPAKGTPAPLAPLPDVVTVPLIEERREREPERVAQAEPADESVNSFDGPRYEFYGAWPAYPRHGHRPGGDHAGPRPEPHASGGSARPAPHATAPAPAPRTNQATVRGTLPGRRPGA